MVQYDQGKPSGADWLGRLISLLEEESCCCKALLVLYAREEEILRSGGSAFPGELIERKKAILEILQSFEARLEPLREKWSELDGPYGLYGAAIARLADSSRSALTRISDIGELLVTECRELKKRNAGTIRRSDSSMRS
jgi:hypothetical protein